MFIIFSRACVSQKCAIKLTNFVGIEIEHHKYLNNKVGFKIQSENCLDLKVSKDGQSIELKDAYIDTGKYEITAKELNESIKITIQALDQERKTYIHYNVFRASFSVIQCITNIAANKNEKIRNAPQYWNIRRTETVNETKFREYFNGNIKLFKYFEIEDLYEPDINNIYSIIEEYPNAEIIFGTEDFTYMFAYSLFMAGVPFDRFHIDFYSDGSATYTMFAEFKRLDFNELVNEWQETIKKGYSQVYIHPYDCRRCLFFVIAAQPYATLYPQHADLLKMDFEEWSDVNIVELNPQVLINTLPDKNDFLKIFFVDIEEWTLKYGEKTPFLILFPIANDFAAPFKSIEEYTETLKSLMIDNHKYSYFLKPHPRASLSTKFIKAVNQIGIQVLPNQVPSEAIIVAFDGIKIGGHFSTVMLTLTPSFIFADSFESLEYEEFRGLLENCSYIMPKHSSCIKECIISGAAVFGVSCLIFGIIMFIVCKKLKNTNEDNYLNTINESPLLNKKYN